MASSTIGRESPAEVQVLVEEAHQLWQWQQWRRQQQQQQELLQEQSLDDTGRRLLRVESTVHPKFKCCQNRAKFGSAFRGSTGGFSRVVDSRCRSRVERAFCGCRHVFQHQQVGLELGRSALNGVCEQQH